MTSREPKLIVNVTRGCVVCERGMIADRAPARMRGLLGQAQLASGDGLLLDPAPSIHTAFMRFPIDAVFLNSELRVIKLVQRLGPWRAASARRAKAVLELPAGECARRDLNLGDQLAIVEPVRHCSRVLLVASDRRFRAVACALLSQRGCAVTTHDELTGVAELATRARADVVVIDASPSLTATAQAAASLDRLRRPVGVVAVADDPEQRLSTLPVRPKWGAFDALYLAIEQAREATR